MPKRSTDMMFSHHQLETIARGGLVDAVTGVDFHPDYPFLTMFRIGRARHFCKEAYCFIFYLVDVAKIAVSFNLRALRKTILECMAYPKYCKYVRWFFELFDDHIDDLYYTVEDAIKYKCLNGEQYSLALLGRRFTAPARLNKPDKVKMEITLKWLNFSVEDPIDLISNDSEERMKFRSKMLAENGYDEMANLSLVIAEPFMYADYPPAYVQRLEHAKYVYENKDGSSTASSCGWSSASSDEWLA